MTAVRVSRDVPGVCSITLDDPGRLNALTVTTQQSLLRAVQELVDDTDTSVVVIRGEGRAFSAGADVGRMDGAAAVPTWNQRRRAFGAWQRTLAALEALPQVTIGALHGWTIGGAGLLAMACDIRIGADDLRYSIPELALGIPLTWAGLPRLVREIGLPRTRDLVLSRRVVNAAEALEWGLVTRVVPGDQLDAAVSELAQELLAVPPPVLSMTKESLAAIGQTMAPMGAAWADADLLAWSFAEPEVQAAFARYVERQRAKPLKTD